MKPLANPRDQTFGFLYDTINERLGRDVTPKGLLDVNGINAAFGGNGNAASPVNWAASAQQQTPASTGGYASDYAVGGTTQTAGAGNNPNLVGGILDARNLVTNMYQQELGRAPDYAGLDSWSNAVFNGMTQQQLLDAIRASSEYKARIAGNTASTTPYYYGYSGPDGGGGNPGSDGGGGDGGDGGNGGGGGAAP